jgi:hypothetical protein
LLTSRPSVKSDRCSASEIHSTEGREGSEVVGRGRLGSSKPCAKAAGSRHFRSSLLPSLPPVKPDWWSNLFPQKNAEDAEDLSPCSLCFLLCNPAGSLWRDLEIPPYNCLPPKRYRGIVSAPFAASCEIWFAFCWRDSAIPPCNSLLTEGRKGSEAPSDFLCYLRDLL